MRHDSLCTTDILPLAGDPSIRPPSCVSSKIRPSPNFASSSFTLPFSDLVRILFRLSFPQRSSLYKSSRLDTAGSGRGTGASSHNLVRQRHRLAGPTVWTPCSVTRLPCPLFYALGRGLTLGHCSSPRQTIHLDTYHSRSSLCPVNRRIYHILGTGCVLSTGHTVDRPLCRYQYSTLLPVLITTDIHPHRTHLSLPSHVW